VSNIEQTAISTQIYCGATPQLLRALAVPMDIQKILAELHEQRDQVTAVIEALETIAFQHKPRRGRPPKWLTVNRIATSKNGSNGFLNGSLPLPPPKNGARNSTFEATSGTPD